MGAWGKENFFAKSFPSPKNFHLQQPIASTQYKKVRQAEPGFFALCGFFI